MSDCWRLHVHIDKIPKKRKLVPIQNLNKFELHTIMCLSIGTHTNNKFSMENFLFLGVPKFGHIMA